MPMPHNNGTGVNMKASLFSDKGLSIASQDFGPWECYHDDRKHEAIQEEFESLIRDPDTISNAFAEGIRIDAIAAALWAQLGEASKPSLYEAVAKRLEHSLSEKIWDFATENVDGRAE